MLYVSLCGCICIQIHVYCMYIHLYIQTYIQYKGVCCLISAPSYDSRSISSRVVTVPSCELNDLPFLVCVWHSMMM